MEIFSPQPGAAGGVYQLKYTPPFRSTLRPPPQNCSLGVDELPQLNNDLNQLVNTFDARGNQAPNVPGAQQSVGEEPLKQMEDIGNTLFDLVVPPYIQADLRPEGRYLEIGMEEALLGYPWELMHDGDNFLCLKHFMGRFVNAASPQQLQVVTRLGTPHQTLSVLLIVVPRPQRLTNDYEDLTQADAEANKIVEILTKTPGVKVDDLRGKRATFNAVRQALKAGGYHIVHFCGHAKFNDQSPRMSCLVLQDKDMTTGAVVTFVSQTRPILCFVNACETAKTAEGKDRLNVFGLAQAFLETGAYLLGTRWKVSDAAASAFAGTFYTSWLRDGNSLGQAIRDARVDCKKAAPNDFAWASYILYGDPRVYFGKVK